MKHFTPREDTYSKGDAVLTIGVDPNGRIYSRIEKNGNTVATDIYVRLPSEATLVRQGWTRNG